MSSYKAFYWRQIGVKLAAILTFIMGVINLTSGVQPALHARLQILEQILPLEIRHGSRITSVLAGFGLILLANNLSRRKKAAWFFSMALLLITGISHLFKGLDYEEAIFSLLLVIILFLLRNEFHAASDPPSVKQGLTVLGAAFGFTLIYGMVGFFMLDQHFDIPFNLISTINQIILMFVTFSTPVIQPVTKFGHYFLISINIIGLATIGFAILMLIRPVLIRHPATQKERELASSIANQFGRTALTWATLFEDKSYFFLVKIHIALMSPKGAAPLFWETPLGQQKKRRKRLFNLGIIVPKRIGCPRLSPLYQIICPLTRLLDLRIYASVLKRLSLSNNSRWKAAKIKIYGMQSVSWSVVGFGQKLSRHLWMILY